MVKNRKLIISSILTLVFLWIPLAGKALNQDQYFYLGSEEEVQNNFVWLGQIVNIEGKVNQDVIAIAQNINIKGEVFGDVLAIGGEIKIEGPVHGNVRVAGASVEISGSVDKNVQVAAGRFILEKGSKVGWDLGFWGNIVELKGEVKGRVDGYGHNVILAHKIGESVSLNLNPEGSLILNSSALIKGDLTYDTLAEAVFNPGSQVLGESIQSPVLSQSQEAEQFWAEYFLKKIISLFGLLVVGMFLIYLLGNHTSLKIVTLMWYRSFFSLGWGIIYLIVVPVICLLLFFTIIGIPLSIITFIFYLIAIYFSQIFVGLVFGVQITSWFNKIRKKKEKNKKKDENKPNNNLLLWPFTLGMIITVVIFSLPFFGWFLKILGMAWGLGAIGGMIRLRIYDR